MIVNMPAAAKTNAGVAEGKTVTIDLVELSDDIDEIVITSARKDQSAADRLRNCGSRLHSVPFPEKKEGSAGEHRLSISITEPPQCRAVFLRSYRNAAEHLPCRIFFQLSMSSNASRPCFASTF